MKKLQYITSLIMIIAMLGYIGCSNDDEETAIIDPQTEQLVKLQNEGASWVLGSTGSVTKDGFNVTDQYTGFRLTVGEFTYVVENSTGTAWPNNNGTWQFANEQGTIITRDGSTDITVSITETTLTLTFTAPDTGGRLNSVGGSYEFILESE